MAQKVQVLFEDDLDGSEAEGTINFALDGADYEIDLNTAHADDLRNVFAPYLAVARRITTAPKRGGKATARTHRADTTEARNWLKANGYEVKDRGRIPDELMSAFQSRTPATPPAPEPEPEPNVVTVPFQAPDTGTATTGKTTTRRRTPRKTKDTA